MNNSNDSTILNKILIKDVLLNDQITDVLIVDNHFAEISSEIEFDSSQMTLLNGSNKAILPPFYNCHTHAGMTLMRGYADDMELFPWLSEYIWPLESKLKASDVYYATKLACVEMIRSGTVFFADMYFHQDQAIKAAEEMGLRISTGQVLLDAMDIKTNQNFWNELDQYSDLLIPTIAPHAIYTVGEENLKWAGSFSLERDIHLHIHVSETIKEVEDCISAHNCRPVEWLDKCGVINSKTILAHAIHLNDNEIEIISKRGATVVHNPASNLKLTSGVFNYDKLKAAGVNVALGTDGPSSNNNLSMIEEAKLASLVSKLNSENPKSCTAEESYKMASINGAQAFGIDAGEISVGKLADAILVDLSNHRLVPNHNLTSNMIYSADSSCIDSVICNGRVLMSDKVILGESIIIDEARIATKSLLER